MAEFNEQLTRAMRIRGVSQSELCKKTKIPKSAMSQYMSGSFKPKQTRTYLLAVALNVNEAWLMGYEDIPMERSESSHELVNNDPELTEYLEQLKNRKEMRMLFSIAKDANKEDVERAVKVVEALFDKKN